ncbi:MAG TPA: tetratricopeptide repeat protein, partial [Syntrophales bacterium]|nr:tetratricopeptide repeat protein [Syntrophales bacterium]
MKNLLRTAILLTAALAALGGLAPPSTAQETGSPSPPTDAAYHYSLGTMLSLDGKLKEAAREYEKALELDPKSAFLATELAGLYVKMGD